MLVLINIEDEDKGFGLPKASFAELVDQFPEVDFQWNMNQRDFHKGINRAEVLWSWRLSEELLRLAGDLKWFHCQAVGVRSSISALTKESGFILTNASGVSSKAMAEHCLALILAFTRGILGLMKFKDERRWAQNFFTEKWGEMKELSEHTFGIVGVGSTGSEIARVLKAFSASVLGYRLRQKPCEFVDELFFGEQLPEMLKRCDFVIDTLPATERTFHFFNSEVFSNMKDSSVFINLGRGWTVDETALLRALGWNERDANWESGWLRGAALDVFKEEPLPTSSPLWSAPHVIISPHVSAISSSYWRNSVNLFTENLRRYLNGENLLNLVDLNLGY